MADNCEDQNKNKFMMYFLCYLCIINDNLVNIHLRFLISGHTKNFCDACFGMIKRALKIKDALVPEDLVQIYSNSASCNRVETTETVIFYDWKAFLDQFFTSAVVKMKTFHHFYFSKHHPGVVKHRRLSTSTDEYSTTIIRPNVSINDIKNPLGVYKPLQHFKIDPSQYSLLSAINAKRKEYLDEILSTYYVNNYYAKRDKFYSNGGDQL